MASPVVTVAPDTKVGDAVYLMKTRNIGSVVVIGSEQLAGIVTERDLLLKLAASPYAFYAPVSSIMSKPRHFMFTEHNNIQRICNYA